MKRIFVFILSILLGASAAGCSGNAVREPILPPPDAQGLGLVSGSGQGKIKHVVYIVQENRSFNDLFMGYPNARTSTTAKTSTGQTITLQPVSLTLGYDIDHTALGMFLSCNAPAKDLPGTHCKMDGFNKVPLQGGPPNGQFAYVPRSESKPYWDMATEWVLADHMFASQLDESFVAHQYIIAAQAQSSVNVPGGNWGCERQPGDKVQTITHKRTYGKFQRPCFDYTTLGDELDNAGLPWRFYTSPYNKPLGGLWSGYQAVDHIYNGPDWKKDVITPQKRFLKDVKAGKLAAFTWITPICPDSDHTDLRRRLRPVVGDVARQRGRREQVLGFHRRLRAVGRLGRSLRSGSPAVQGLRRARISSTAARDLAVCEEKIMFRTYSTRRQACCDTPKISSAFSN